MKWPRAQEAPFFYLQTRQENASPLKWGAESYWKLRLNVVETVQKLDRVVEQRL
jgi:hypothetical protein